MGFNGEGFPDQGDADGLGPDTISITPINLCQLPYPGAAFSSKPLRHPSLGGSWRGRCCQCGVLDIGSFGSIEQRHHDLQD